MPGCHVALVNIYLRNNRFMMDLHRGRSNLDKSREYREILCYPVGAVVEDL